MSYPVLYRHSLLKSASVASAALAFPVVKTYHAGFGV